MSPRHGLSLQQMPSSRRIPYEKPTQILRFSWSKFVRNSEIFVLTGLPAINVVIRHRRIVVFGHIAKLQDNTPAHKALHPHVNLTLVVFPVFNKVVAHVADGSTKFETTSARHLTTSGERPLEAVIVDVRRDG